MHKYNNVWLSVKSYWPIISIYLLEQLVPNFENGGKAEKNQLVN